MRLKLLLATAAAAALAFTQACAMPVTVIVDPATGQPYVGGLPISGSFSATLTAFNPKGDTTLAVTTTSARVALPTADKSVLIRNTGSSDAYIAFGTVAVNAATTNTLIPAGQAVAFDVGTGTYIAAITASGSTSLAVTTGTGLPALTGGGGAGGGGTATSANQVTGNTSLAAISAAVLPYTPDSYTLQITAPTSTAVRSTVLGTGTTVAVYNSGLVPEFVAVGNSAVTATTGSWLVPPGNICYFNYAGGSAYVSGITSSGTGQLTLSSGSGGAQGCTTYTDVTTPSNVTALANATGGATPLTTAALSTTVTAIKASAGSLYMLRCYNPNATAAYVQVFNVASGSVTLGTTTPVQSYGIPATSAGGVALSPVGMAFSTAISYAATTTATGSTANSTALTCSVAYN